MKKIVFVTLAFLAATSLSTNVNAQLKYQGEANISAGAAFLGAGYDATFVKAGVETVHGLRLSPAWFVGAGVGVHEYICLDNEYQDNETTYDTQFPVFANAKYYFMDQRIAPYLGVDIGYGIGLSKGTPSGLYLSPSAGVNFRLGSRFGLHVGVSYQLQDWGKEFYGDRMWLHGVAAKVGFTW